jgi:uncharacterized membrane protein
VEATRPRNDRLAGYLLGFALGGFFDGILLHQVLQWHHLLSAVGPADLRFQLAADGLFHLLMYVVAALGLWRLWAVGRRTGLPSGQALLADLLIGFGAWHVLDGVVSHWILGIHRIRMESESRLFWDLVWFAIFGLVPIAIGWWLRRGTDNHPGRPAAATLATLLVVAAGLQALRPAGDPRFVTVLFAPGTTQDRIFAALTAIDARPVWADASGEVVVIAPEPDAPTRRLFRYGALFVSGSGLPAGCFDNLRL